MDYPLEGIRVIDFTQYQQGTVSTAMLADWGADVIKVEPHGMGDPGRTLGPRGPKGLRSGYFESNNRNKRGIVVDLKQEKGQEIIYKLVEKGDIVAQNWRVGVAERLGFGYETLSRLNPRIILLNGSGFGREGPMKDRPGFDAVGQAMGGILSVTGPPGVPEQPIGAAVGDQTGGYLMAIGALLALYDRNRTGEGQEVDVSLLGGVIGIQGHVLQAYLLTGQVPKKSRGRISTAIYSLCFRARDGKSFIIQTAGRKAKEVLYKMIDREELLDDPRFNSREALEQHQDELIAIFAEVFATKDRDEWLKQLVEADIVCAPVYNHADVAADPQVLANEYIVEVDHPIEGRMKILNNPVQLSKYKAKIGIAPEQGQHTDEVLREIGYSEAEIAGLKEQEVIG